MPSRRCKRHSPDRGITTTGAEARTIFPRLRGAKTPLFHGRVGAQYDQVVNTVRSSTRLVFGTAETCSRLLSKLLDCQLLDVDL